MSANHSLEPASNDPRPDPPGVSVTRDEDPALANVYAELAKIVLGSQPLGALLRQVSELAVKAIPGIDEASVTLVERGRAQTVAFSGQLAATLDERQYEAGFGPCLDAAAYGQSIVVDTSKEDGIYADFARQARRQGVRYVVSVGMPALQGIGGGMNIYSSGAAGPIDDATVNTATMFAGHAAVTMFNAALYAGAREQVAQMKQAMASRAQIEQAKGVIMRERRCTAEEAFEVLAEMSSRSNRKLRDIALSVITDAGAQ
jgi:GAF domain-containing protein